MKMHYYLLMALLISSSIFPITKDNAILSAAELTGMTIGALLGYFGIPKLIESRNVRILKSNIPTIVGTLAGIKAGARFGMRYLQQKHNVSTRVLKIALRYNYDLSTDQRMILEVAEQKNHAILKKYLSDLLQQHFGEHGIEKFQSFMREYRTIAKSHQSPATILPLFVAKIGKDTATLLTKVLEIGIIPLAILYFNMDEWYAKSIIPSFGGLSTLPDKMVIAYDFMKAVGVYKK